jgi:hypothetical protein
MKHQKALTFILTLGLFSCNGKTENTSTKTENILSDIKVPVAIPDTIMKFVVDDYPVSNEMFADKTSNNSSYKKQSGQTFSYDKKWFRNHTLKQILVFELYTDYHRLLIYKFLENDIPNDLIKRIELHLDNGKLATDEQKLKDFDGFLKQATKINSTYFITYKGFRLGDTKQKSIDIYGNPNKQTTTDGIERLEWIFIGENSSDNKADLKGKSIAVNSFGHQIIMYFRNGKLIGQILHNEIP